MELNNFYYVLLGVVVGWGVAAISYAGSQRLLRDKLRTLERLLHDLEDKHREILADQQEIRVSLERWSEARKGARTMRDTREQRSG